MKIERWRHRRTRRIAIVTYMAESTWYRYEAPLRLGGRLAGVNSVPTHWFAARFEPVPRKR